MGCLGRLLGLDRAQIFKQVTWMCFFSKALQVIFGDILSSFIINSTKLFMRSEVDDSTLLIFGLLPVTSLIHYFVHDTTSNIIVLTHYLGFIFYFAKLVLDIEKFCQKECNHRPYVRKRMQPKMGKKHRHHKPPFFKRRINRLRAAKLRKQHEEEKKRHEKYDGFDSIPDPPRKSTSWFYPNYGELWDALCKKHPQILDLVLEDIFDATKQHHMTECFIFNIEGAEYNLTDMFDAGLRSRTQAVYGINEKGHRIIFDTGASVSISPNPAVSDIERNHRICSCERCWKN